MKTTISILAKESLPAKGVAHFWFENDFFLCQTHQQQQQDLLPPTPTIYGIHLSKVEETGTSDLILKPMKYSGVLKRRRSTTKKKVLTAPEPPKKKIKSEHLKIPRSLFEQVVLTLPAPTPALRKIFLAQITTSAPIITLLTQNHNKLSNEWWIKIVGRLPDSLFRFASRLTSQQYIHHWFLEFVRAYDLKQIREIYENKVIKQKANRERWNFDLTRLMATGSVIPQAPRLPSPAQILLNRLRGTPLKDYSMEQGTYFEWIRIELRELIKRTQQEPLLQQKQQLNRAIKNVLRRIALMHSEAPRLGIWAINEWGKDLEKQKEVQSFFRNFADPLVDTSLQAIRIFRAVSPNHALTLEDFLALLWMANFVAEIQQKGYFSATQFGILVLSNNRYHWKNIIQFIHMENVRIQWERHQKTQLKKKGKDESSFSPTDEEDQVMFWN